MMMVYRTCLANDLYSVVVVVVVVVVVGGGGGGGGGGGRSFRCLQVWRRVFFESWRWLVIQPPTEVSKVSGIFYCRRLGHNEPGMP
jgi:hypothetical protein